MLPASQPVVRAAVPADAEPVAAIFAHRRRGFTQAGRLAAVGRKHGRWIDTVLMQRGLGRDG